MSGTPFTREDTAAVLAGLRLLQAALPNVPPEIEEILTDGGTHAIPSASHIDDLCIMVNVL